MPNIKNFLTHFTCILFDVKLSKDVLKLQVLFSRCMMPTHDLGVKLFCYDTFTCRSSRCKCDVARQNLRGYTARRNKARMGATDVRLICLYCFLCHLRL